jgi:predicted ATPase
MALLERDGPLASLADYADQARRGEGRVVLVAGEAGVGKSALLEQFAAGLAQ